MCQIVVMTGATPDLDPSPKLRIQCCHMFVGSVFAVMNALYHSQTIAARRRYIFVGCVPPYETSDGSFLGGSTTIVATKKSFCTKLTRRTKMHRIADAPKLKFILPKLEIWPLSENPIQIPKSGSLKCEPRLLAAQEVPCSSVSGSIVRRARDLGLRAF